MLGPLFFSKIALGQGPEHDDRVHPVDKFRAEDPAQGVHQLFPHLGIGFAFFLLLVFLDRESQAGLPFDHVSPDVGGHHDDGVAEVHFTAPRVRELALFHDLKEHVVGFRMCFFDLIKDHDGVGSAAQGFGELAGFFVPDVSGRCSDQAADSMPLHELRHVQLDQGIFTAEQEAGQGFGQFGFPDPGGS